MEHICLIHQIFRRKGRAKRNASIKKCYELFGDEDSKQWVEDDQKKVNKIEQQIKEVIAFMDANNIK